MCSNIAYSIRYKSPLLTQALLKHPTVLLPKEHNPLPLSDYSSAFPCLSVLFQLFPCVCSQPEWLCQISGCGSSRPSCSLTAASVLLRAGTCHHSNPLQLERSSAGMNQGPGRRWLFPGNRRTTKQGPRHTRLGRCHAGCRRVGLSANKIPRGHPDVAMGLAMTTGTQLRWQENTKPVWFVVQ